MKLLQSYYFICLAASFVNNLNAQWVPTNGPREGLTLSLAVGTNSAGDTTLYAGTWNGCVFSTTNNGGSWTQIDGGTWWVIPQDTGFTFSDIRLLATISNGTHGTCLFAVNVKGKLFRSLNADTNWTALDSNIAHHPVSTMLIQDTNIFVGTDSGVFRSTDHGTNWTIFNNELTPYGVYSLICVRNVTESTTFFAATTGGIFISTNNGMNWIAANTEIHDLFGLTVMYETTEQMNLYAISADYNNIYRSTDSGVSWLALNRFDSFFNYSIRCIAVHDTIIYASANGDGPSMYYSLNRGVNWTVGNYGLGRQRPIYAFLINGEYLYAACASDVGTLNGVWKRPLSELLTAVRDKEKQNPTQFFLEQNYPNPFNPTTVISYQLSSSSYVVLKVYDVLGREVETLVNAQQLSGIHNVAWHASDISSGIYFYRLTTNNVSQTKKMILQK